MKGKNFFFFIEFCVLNAAAVHIVNLGVPSSYVLEENFCRPLILDCDFEFHAKDVGFVLKWYHNNDLIYQWIPPRKPFPFSISKYHINVSFIITANVKYKHRAIQLRPHFNLTGEWMCSVSTYYNRDRKIKAMKIIVPEKSFELYHHDIKFFKEISEYFLIICSVKHIFPEPELSILIDNSFKITSEEKSESDENGFFNKSIMARVDKNFIPSPSTINCILQIHGTDYIKKKEFIYYEYKFDKKYFSGFERFSSNVSMRIGVNLVVIALVVLFFVTP